jgi:DNA mismatch endonuclease (patch repair protein)
MVTSRELGGMMAFLKLRVHNTKGLSPLRLYDPLTRSERSERMSRIRNADTKPEMIVRRLIHGMGYRYRLHAKNLPGKPDLAFSPRHKVIFVHGCFWHQHGCGQYRMPKTRQRFWEPKLAGNKARDTKIQKALREAGWRSLIVWECQLKRSAMLKERIRRFLESRA